LQAVPFAKGQALADEFGIKFFETVSVTELFIYDFHVVHHHQSVHECGSSHDGDDDAIVL
jgi:hypothetical protein